MNRTQVNASDGATSGHRSSGRSEPSTGDINGAGAISRRTVLLGAIVVLLIAAGTRFIGLGRLDAWGDEVYSHVSSSELLPKLLKWETPGNESSSPIPFIEIKFSRQLLGDNEWGLRLPSAAHGTAAVLLLYFVVGWLVNWRVAFWAALLLAINPYSLEWSREGRMYTQWLVGTLLVTAVAYAATAHCRTRDTSPLNWRWWLLGVLFMYAHATNVCAVMTIGAVGLWLGLIGLIELRRSWRVGRGVLLGSALATVVYLGSWGLTGIAKMLILIGGKAEAARDYVQPILSDELLTFAGRMAGNAPMWVALVVWALVLAGMIGLVVAGRWRVALLVVMVSLMPWASYTQISSAHFFAPRYVFTGLILVSVGLAISLAWFWRGRWAGDHRRWAGPLLVVALLAGLAACWTPVWREVFGVPKMSVRAALAPVQQHAVKGEVFMLVPDWYAVFDEFEPYQFGEQIRVIRPPKAARYQVGEDDRFDGEFEELFKARQADAGDDTNDGDSDKPPPIPPAAWLMLVRPGADAGGWQRRLEQVAPVLEAYGLDRDALAEHVNDDVLTLTVRVSRQGLSWITPTPGRKHR